MRRSEGSKAFDCELDNTAETSARLVVQLGSRLGPLLERVRDFVL